MEFTILIRRAEEGGFWAEAPALSPLPWGDTADGTLENIGEAIEGHVEALQQEGLGIPGGRPDQRQGQGL